VEAHARPRRRHVSSSGESARGGCWQQQQQQHVTHAPSRHTPQMRPASSRASWYLQQCVGDTCARATRQSPRHPGTPRLHAHQQLLRRRHDSRTHLLCQAFSWASCSFSSFNSSCGEHGADTRAGPFAGIRGRAQQQLKRQQCRWLAPQLLLPLRLLPGRPQERRCTACGVRGPCSPRFSTHLGLDCPLLVLFGYGF
jgi:hypothetical protein